MADEAEKTLIFTDTKPRPPVARLSELPRGAEEGWLVYVREDNAFYVFRGGKWVLRRNEAASG